MSEPDSAATAGQTSSRTTTETTRTATTTSVMVDGKNGKMPWGAGKVWWLAALPLMGGLTAVSTPWAVNHIENQLESEARRDLTAAGIDPSGLDIDFDYRDGDAVGDLPDGVTASAAAAAVDDGLLRDFDVSATEAPVETTPETVVTEAPEPPPTEPVTTEAAELGSTDVEFGLQDGAITLVGTVLSDDQRAQLVEQANDLVGADNVDDQLVVDELDPAVDGADERIGALGAVLAAAGGDDTVTATLSDTSLDVTMTTDSPERAAAMETAFAESGIDDGGVVITTVGAVDAQVAAFGGEIVLSGTVLSNDHRDTLVAAAVDAVGEENVDDQLVVSGLDAQADDTDARIAHLASLMPAMLDTDVATATLTDDSLIVTASGSAESGTALDEAAGAATDVDTTVDFTAEADDDVATQVDQLQAELDALAEEIRENVVFATSSTELSSTATETLDKVVAAMERYQLPVVDVSGHTDSRGDADANQSLSQGRAESVVAYLVEQGIPAERIQARGAGETEPIASNDTSAGQAENRRVEFAALASFD